MKILWLASWYPNKLSPLNGDFIQRHAGACSLFNDITVIHVVRDKNRKITASVKETENHSGQLNEKIIYYHTPSFFSKSLERFISIRKYKQLYKEAVNDYVNNNGIPDLVHLHVTMNAGIIALWIKKKYKIPYVITEHWSGLLKEANDNFFTKSPWFKSLWEKAFLNAASVSVVSNYLNENINNIIPGTDAIVIPNVVDTNLFVPAKEIRNNKEFIFIHITRMDYQKNPEAVWQAFHLVKQKKPSFKLIVYTNETAEIEKLNKQYDLSENLLHKKEVPQTELVSDIQNADALILFSRYETFGCVVAEANACGVPVIVSDIAVMHELVQEGMNVLFAINDNASSLADKILAFMNSGMRFNKEQIAADAAAKFNYQKVGEQFADWYKQVIKF